MQDLKKIVLSSLRALGRSAGNYFPAAFSLYLQSSLLIFMLVVPLFISLIFVTADDEMTTTQAIVQTKYAILAGYPLLGILLGTILRWYELKNRRKKDQMQCRSKWLDIAKVGILLGGLASAKLAGIIAVVREVVGDADLIASESVLFMAVVPMFVIVLVTYTTARDAISKE